MAVVLILTCRPSKKIDLGPELITLVASSLRHIWFILRVGGLGRDPSVMVVPACVRAMKVASEECLAFFFLASRDAVMLYSLMHERLNYHLPLDLGGEADRFHSCVSVAYIWDNLG